MGRWSFYYGWLPFIPLARLPQWEWKQTYPQTWGWGLLYGYVVGISLYAKNESINKEEPHRVAIFLLFLPSLCALGGLVLWNNLDPIRVFLVNVSGLLVGWIVFDSILSMRGEGKGELLVKGFSSLLAGICGVDAITLAFVCPILVGPVTFGIFLSHLAQKEVCSDLSRRYRKNMLLTICHY